MNGAPSTPALASVVVLAIRDFNRRAVGEQAQLKAQLETLVVGAIRPLPVAERIVLDAPGGLAIVLLGSPEIALELAERGQEEGAHLPLCIGINHGPVRPESDASRGPGLVGDGIASGLALANAAAPGRYVASRAFREALADCAPDRAAVFNSVGVFTDPNVRTHELYAPDRGAALARRRWLFAACALTVVAVLGLGITARAVRGRSVPPAPPRPAQKKRAETSPAPGAAIQVSGAWLPRR